MYIVRQGKQYRDGDDIDKGGNSNESTEREDDVWLLRFNV